ncbi:MAG: hypothetical protein IKT39_02610 [Clostridia bacterium]|nr:hypothetical protein [Clostridia bacterium]
MCRFKSMIFLKDRVFIPDYDSHQDMLEELKIEDNQKNAERVFVRVELSPEDGDVFSDISTWKFKADQDILPKWYVEEVDKKRAVEAVTEWAKEHIFIEQDNLTLKEGGTYYIKDCKNVEAWGSATVKACGSATVKACGSATVRAWDSATVEACDSATVEACGSATVKACGSATVRAWDSATVEACDSATVYNSLYIPWRNKDTIILADNATFKDNDTKTIYQSGNWKLVIVESEKK